MRYQFMRMMCFGGGGGGSAPAVQPPPAPPPTPTPTTVNPVANAQDRAKNLDSYRYGLASTIKTGAGGITGKGADLQAPSITGVNTTGQSRGVI